MFIVYKTTNVVNNRYYIGVHETETPFDFDEYLGSGKILFSAIKKYGRFSFTRETLFVFSEASEAFTKEREIVRPVEIDPLSYNIREGGSGAGKLQFKKNFFNPEVFAFRIAKMRETTKTEEYRTKKSDIARDAYKDPEKKSNHVEGCKSGWADPIKKAGRVEKCNTPEILLKKSEASKRKWADPIFRQRMKEIHKRRFIKLPNHLPN